MDDDQNIPAAPVAEVPAQAPEPAPTPVEPESSQPNGSTPTDLPLEAPESPISVPAPIPVESQNGGANQPESDTPEPSNEAPVSIVQPVPDQSESQSPHAPTSAIPQSEPISGESPAFRDIQARGRSKIQTNRQEKLDKLIQFAQKKQVIDNEEIQMLLHVSSATATRYLEDLVKEGHLVSEGSPRHAKYRFVR
jgi:hypothetical protein